MHGVLHVSDNSTKVYYVVLRTEASIPDNVTDAILKSFRMDNPVSVDTLKVTTGKYVCNTVAG